MSGVPTQSNKSDSGKGRHTHTSCHRASRVITGARILVANKPNLYSSGLVQFVLKPTLLPLHHCSTHAGSETHSPSHVTLNTCRRLAGGA